MCCYSFGNRAQRLSELQERLDRGVASEVAFTERVFQPPVNHEPLL